MPMCFDAFLCILDAFATPNFRNRISDSRANLIQMYKSIYHILVTCIPSFREKQNHNVFACPYIYGFKAPHNV